MPLWPALLIVHGVVAIFLFTLLHETVHNTPFKSVWLNRLVGHLCGFILFIPAGWFLFFHLAHHRHTQIPDKDPELVAAKPTTKLGFVWYVSGIATWVGIGRVSSTTLEVASMTSTCLPVAALASRTRLAFTYSATWYCWRRACWQDQRFSSLSGLSR